MDPRRAARLGLLIGSWIAGLYLVLSTFVTYGRAGAIGEDAHAYWLTAHTSHLYGGAPGTKDAYLYSPLFAQVIHPLAMLSFHGFTVVLIAIDVAAFAWLLAPLGWLWATPLMLLCSMEFVLGQVIGVITVAVVIAILGRPAWWAVGWVVKVTPGVLGAVWCAGRKDWRSLAISLAVTGGVCTLSFVLWPSAWIDWWRFSTSTSGGAFVAVRLVAAITLVWVGARRHWWWVVPVALLVSAPTLGAQDVCYLAGLVRLKPLGQATRNPMTREAHAGAL